MFKGEKLKVIHPISGAKEEVIVAGADPNKGITLVYINEPERIAFCSTKDEEAFEGEWKWFIKVMSNSEEERVLDAIGMYMSIIGIPEKRRSHLQNYVRAECLRKCMVLGASQEYLQSKCAFKKG